MLNQHLAHMRSRSKNMRNLNNHGDHEPSISLFHYFLLIWLYCIYIFKA